MSGPDHAHSAVPLLPASHYVEENGVMSAFDHLGIIRGYWHILARQWPVDGSAVEKLGAAAIASRRGTSGDENVLLEGDGTLLFVSVYDGMLTATCRSVRFDLLETALDGLKEELPEVEHKDPEKVRVHFWTLGQHGPQASVRRIAVPAWETIQGNYPGDFRDTLGQLVKGFRPSEAGQLILWQGVPGTGKTYALRALLREWRPWCAAHYIVDPERFFGSKAEYMLGVLLHAAADPIDDDYEFDFGDDEESDDRWRLLVLEDTGELLAADAKQNVGQGLSRLLNVVDGLIGQGLRILVLVTTNEELGKLHPAVKRYGRCAAEVTFRPFDREEAREWLRDNGHEDLGPPASQSTLAELYGHAHGREEQAKQPVGFA